MKSQYASNMGYYEWDAHTILAGKLHEGDVKRFIDNELRSSKRFFLEDYASLFRWTMEHKDNEHLFNDAVYICEKINDKIRSCHKIPNKETEYNKNRIRLKMLNDRASTLYSIEKKNRSLRKSLVNSAYLLHDYDQLLEVFREVKKSGSKSDRALLNHDYKQKNLPLSENGLDFIGKRRKSYKPKSKLEILVGEPVLLFVSGGLPGDIKPALLDYQREQNEKSCSEILLENPANFYMSK